MHDAGAVEAIMGDRCVDSIGWFRSVAAWLVVSFTVVSLAPTASAQIVRAADPGVRSDSGVNAGAPLSGLSAGQMSNFAAGLATFVTARSVSGSVAGEPQEGLGPRYNSNSCGSCHSQPAPGGSSPSATVFPNVGPNPQVAGAHDAGATNQVPFFVTANGPVREARFPYVVNSFGFVTDTPDGGVHDLYTVTGRSDATNQPGATGVTQTCSLSQPAFDQARRFNNIIFRIPTPLFGAGLIESVSDKTILENQAANATAKRAFGIGGHPNRNGNDGTITKFGWKAQNATLLMFAGEAYNVEMGVTNELFATERASPGEVLPVSCIFNQTPEDTSHLDFDPANPGGDATSPYSDIQLFTIFMELLGPPTASMSSPGGSASIARGETLFRGSLGCSLCHTPTLMASVSPFINQGNPPQSAVNLFSDLLVHRMGDVLADRVSQGLAGPSEFRTAPLWGLGQRIFFLHDGRTTDLVQVIHLHGDSESEARVSAQRFFGLSETSKQDVLNFLRSL
jgi:CxxC motif-containing protein (DUF1111 family)